MVRIVEIKIIDDIKYKECTKCKEWKSYDEYNKHVKSKFGIQSNCRECGKKISKTFYKQNSDKINEKTKEYIKQNKEQYGIYQKEYQKEYKEKNKEKNKEYYKLYMAKYHKNRLKTDPDFRLRRNLRCSNYHNLQRAIKYYLEGKVDKIPSKSPSRLLLKLYEIQNHTCPYCSSDMRDNIHIDHIIPLSKNGSNDVENLILCCSTCNLSKSSKNLEDWLNECNINYKEFIGSIEERNRIYFSEEIISA